MKPVPVTGRDPAADGPWWLVVNTREPLASRVATLRCPTCAQGWYHGPVYRITQLAAVELGVPCWQCGALAAIP